MVPVVQVVPVRARIQALWMRCRGGRKFTAYLADPPFLNKVPVRFAISDATQAYDIPERAHTSPLDREKARAFGVKVNSVFQTLQVAGIPE
jgi:hypothetical protein